MSCYENDVMNSRLGVLLDPQLVDPKEWPPGKHPHNAPVCLTRKDLAKCLSVSYRFLADNPTFKKIERHIGGRVLYPLSDVNAIIENSKSKRK